MRNYEERNQSGKSGRTWKRRWRIAALVLCVCVVFTAYPELPSMLSVFAAEETDEGGQETAQEQETQQEQEPAGADTNPGVEESAQTTDSDYAASTHEEVDGVQTAESGQENTTQDGTQEELSGETVSETENGIEQESESGVVSETETILETESETTTEDLADNTNNADETLQKLLKRIAKLPDLEEYLADEPDVEDGENYEAWQEMLYETAQEALVIWEAYEALEQEQQEQLAKKLLEKLTAWVELAKQLTEGSMTMAAADGEHQNHTGWTALTPTSSGSSFTLNSGNYYISASIDRTIRRITIPSGKTVNLCLNGQQYNYRASGLTTYAIEVEEGATLNIHDCAGNGEISNDDGIGIKTSGTLNVYGGAIIGNGDIHSGDAKEYDGAGIYATGANAVVHLYSGCSVTGINGAGVCLDSDTQLLVDGAAIRDEDSRGYRASIAAIYIGEGAKAEIKSGSISGVDIDKPCNNSTIRVLKNATVTISGGTFEGKGVSMYNPTGDTAMSTSGVVVNGGTFCCPVIARNCELTVNGGEFRAGIEIYTVLKISGNQAIRSETEEHDVGLWKESGKAPGIIELTGALTNTDVYRIALMYYKPSSQYPVTITKGYSTYMSGKNPADYFKNIDNYKMILKDGEIVLMPWVMTFDANGGEVGTKTGDINGAQALSGSLPTPTRAGYTCDGWYTQADGGDEITIDNMPLEDITVYAHWTPIPYTITYDLAGGALSGGTTNPTQYTVETPTFTLNNPTKTGYDFTGWSGTDLTGTANKTVEVTKGSLEDRAYTANWSAKSYTVTLNKNGGTGGTALTKYTYGTGAALPTNCKKTGYTFAGWYDNVSLTGTAVTNIAADATGNKTFYAKWTANSYKVTFDYQNATGNNTTKEKDVTYDKTYGTLPSPTKTGYTFQGWYTQADGKGSKVTSAATVKITAAQTLYAYWLDKTPPDAPVLQSGVTLPADWTNTQKTIPLTLSDGVGVTQLWVKTDGGSFSKVDGFSGGTAYVYDDVSDGEHTYQFMAKDAAGNESAPSDVFTVKLDTEKPIIGTLTYGNHKATLWQWIIGKTDLVINVPVTENGSGADEISYTMTPQDGQPQTRTAPLTNGKAEIIFGKAFQGTVTISCTDKVGNVSDSVTVGTQENASGVLVEDTAPTITTNVSEGYYEVPTKLTITVSDDTENAITAGIATITYQVGNGAQQSVTVDGSTLQEKVVFEIPASEIPTGVSQIQIRVTDNAGNSASKEITVKVKGPEHTPEAETDYHSEQLTGLDAGADYVINGTQTVTADENGCIPIQEEWIGTTVDIVKKGNGTETTDSTAQGISLPARPSLAPDAPKKSGCTEHSITLEGVADVEYHIADSADVSGEWQKETGFTGLDEKTVYTFTARYAATKMAFASPESAGTQIATMPEPPTEDKLAIDYMAETFSLKDGVAAFADEGCAAAVTEGVVGVYMGETVYIRYPENGIIPQSRLTAVKIPQRPSAPVFTAQDASYPTAQDGALTGLDAAFAYEIRKDGGEWEDAVLTGTQIKGLGAGTYEVRVKATQNICFCGETARAEIKEQPAKPEQKPDGKVDYEKEILTGLVPGGEYIINGEPVKADENGEIPIKDDWHGKTLDIVKKGDGGATTDSGVQSIPLPQKPSAPTSLGVKDTSCPNAQDGAVTGLDPSQKYEIRKDGGEWEDAVLTGTEIAGLPAGTYEVRIKAEEGTSFPGETVTLTIKETPATPESKPEAKPDAEKGILTGLEPGGEYVINGESVRADENGEIPIRDDWYDKTLIIIKKGNGEDKDDSEPQSVTVPPKKPNTYTVTLSGGKGYTLTALTGSTSPVEEGKSYAFRFALAKGYQKTKSFAVKVNGEKVTLTAQDTYTIQDIEENKTVTVEGVKKKSSSGGSSGSSDGSSDSGSDSTQNPPQKTPGTSPAGTPQETPNTDSSNPDADSAQTNVPKEDTAETETDKPKQDVPSESEKEQTNIRENSDEMTATDSGIQPGTQTTDQNTQTSPENAALAIESGAVTVTVNNVDEAACAAKVANTAAVAGAVLTQEELATAVAGAGIEIRIDVARMEDVPLVDAQVIEQGVEAYQDIFPDMNMGMYIDISMFMRKGSGDWNAVHTTNEPVEIVLDIPQELMSLSADFYILRAHEGAYLLLEDLDDNPDTITIRTEAFSTYAITYQLKDNPAQKGQAQNAIQQNEAPQVAATPAECSLCHICPTFLGICCFIWAAVVGIIITIVLLTAFKRKNGIKQNQ